MSGELSNLKPSPGANRRGKHKGRGRASGNGKTAGRGMKGQKARKSGGVRPGFEGGSMPLQRRLPKRGFKNPFSKTFAEVRVSFLDRFAEGTLVDFAALKEAGLVRGHVDGVKLIGKAELSVRVDVKVNRISAGAREVVESAGGTVELVPDKPKWVRKDDRKAKRAQASGQ